MLENLINFFGKYVSDFGYIIVFLATFLENSFFLGLLVPGETLVILAGFYAAQGKLNLYCLISIVFVGAILGDNLGYFFGRWGEKNFLKKYGKHLFITEDRLKYSRDYFEKNGAKTVFMARFTAVLRALAAFTAGASKMKYHRFFLYDFLGALVWAIGVPLLGYFFGANWRVIHQFLGDIGVVLLIIFILVGLKMYNKKKLKDKNV